MKEWKYRFKRGLASFLTVGMIASGVSTATCLPVHAVEGEKGATEITATPQERLQKLVYAELKKQILDIFNGSTSREKAEFTVVIDFPSQGKNNQSLVDEVSEKAPAILEQLLKECPSELFWYNTESTKWEGHPYKCTASKRGNKENKGNIITTFEFKLAVKEAYQPGSSDSSKEPTSMSVQTIRDTKDAMGEDGLNQLVENIYNGLKDEISKMFNEGSTKKSADFQVIVDCKNQEVADALRKKMEVSASDIVSRLSSECPSELFWYKADSDELCDTKSNQCSNYCVVAPNGNSLYFTFYFAVKDEYRDSNSNGANSLNVAAIQETKEKLNGILDNADMSDYAILCKYRDDLVNKYQGKPSQLPHAFQWLCDQTAAFTTSGTKCYTVKGEVDGNVHTWNIVTIERKSYLVDLQNPTVLFLAGVTANAAGGYTVDKKVYIPDKEQQEKLPVLEGVRYRQTQKDFVFVTQRVQEGVVGSIHTIEVKGNEGYVKFESVHPEVATVLSLGNNQAMVYTVGPGVAIITATAAGNDYFEPKTIEYVLPVKAADGSAIIPGDGSSSVGGGTPGGGSVGGGTPGGGSVGGGTPGGGSVGGGYMIDDSTSVRELLPQTDFMFHSGTSKIVKQVGAADFTITASGQVKGSTVTYASSDPSVATVDVNTGTVHVVAPGTAKISATASETTIHRAVTYEYELEVQ